MARSNWSGSGGWKTINDPTGLLNGRVLVAQAGITAVNEDYLLQIVGTTLAGTTFTYIDYEVQCDYAWSAGAQATIFSGGILGLIARAGGYSLVSGISTAQSCYIGRLNYQKAKAQIVKRSSGIDTVLAEADIPTSAKAKGRRHTASFSCKGSDPATLQFYIDSSLTVNIGDNSSTIITSGDSGLQCGNGTVFVDNYSVLSFGQSTAYTGKLPNVIFDAFPEAPTSGITTMILWFSADYTVVSSGAKVTQWKDRSGRVAGGYQIDNDTTAKQPEINLSSLNNLPTIRFDHTADQNLKGPSNSLLNINGMTGFDNGITVFFLVRFYKAEIGDPLVAGSTTARSALLNYGRSYNSFSDFDSSDNNPNKTLTFSNHSAFSETSNMYDVGDWAIIMYSSGSDTGLRGSWKNAVQVSQGSSLPPSSQDMDSAGLSFYMGRRNFTETNESLLYSSFDIAETIVSNTESAGIPLVMRQKTEGYLAHKWGLTALLPIGHPYKTAQP